MNQISFQAVSQTTTAPAFNVGQRAMTPDGRQWTYVKASAAIVAGNVVVPAATTSVGTTISSSTDSQGRIVYITKASAGWTVGQFAEGNVHIDVGTGNGQVAKIRSNTTDTLELYADTALTTALSTDSTMEIWTQFTVRKAVVTSKLQNATGIAQVAFAADEYGFVLTRGVGRVIAGEALVVGAGFTTGDDTAGQVIKSIVTEGPLTSQCLGTCLNANSAADIGALVFVSVF